MTRPSQRFSLARAVLGLLAGGSIAIVSAACPGRAERAAPPDSAVQAGSPVIEDVVPTPTAVPVVEESSATFEVPVPAPAEAAPPAPVAAIDDRPDETPSRCIMLHVSPGSSSAYGVSGEVVQLVVRAQNGCSSTFSRVSFEAKAIGPDGRELASAFGRFPEAIPPGGSAQTLIAIPTKPNVGLTYRAEVAGS